MRKLMPALALLVLTTCCASPPQALPAEAGARVLAFDVLPRTIEGKIVVPLRAIFEWLGARVEYSAGRIDAYQGSSAIPQVSLAIGDRAAKLSGSPHQLEVAPVAIAGRTFVPLRFVAEAFGVWVESQGRTVTLRKPQENLEAVMAIPPAEGSHLAKIWLQIARFYDLQDVEQMSGPLPHWSLYSDAQKARIVADVGSDAPTVVEAHWGGRGVKGIRIISNELDLNAGKAQLDVLVKWEDDEVSVQRFGMVLQRTGWRVDDRVRVLSSTVSLSA